VKKNKPIKFLILLGACFLGKQASSQLIITPPPGGAVALAQRLVGDGVVISNISFTGNLEMAAFFENQGGNNVLLDSGIILTSGRAKTGRGNTGVDGNGSTLASNVLANNHFNLPGDADLSLEIGGAVLKDACVLEFDFIPLGDSIRFNYVFSSEEYTPAFACSSSGTGFNDAFAFFITGPGITGRKNIALIPNTTLPVSIFNVNNVVDANGVPLCPNNPQYFINNKTNTLFTHDGHTTVFAAIEKVVPCEVYHLKLVIADNLDDQYDSGVFLEARSLSSNAIGMENQTQTDNQGNSYLVEGCATGAFVIKRPHRDPAPLSVTLSYGGTAQNGIDVQLLPTIVTIPANDSFVVINVIPVVDGIPEGIETVKVYALAGCASGAATDSVEIQIRDYDTLGITPRNTSVCANAPLQLIASPGYSVYRWDPDPTLNDLNSRTPIASPVNNPTVYYCTATEGTCRGRDSTILRIKSLSFLSQLNVNCKGANTGEIKVASGGEWISPFEFSINGSSWQSDSTFSNLPVGQYIVRIRDANCVDSVTVNIIQAFPDLILNTSSVSDASCSGNPDGSITLSAAGGNAPYSYSLDGTNFQSSNVFNVVAGNYSVSVKDANGCLALQNLVVRLNNTVTVDAGIDTAVCESASYLIPATSNGNSFSWSPASSLDNSSGLTPVATPYATTWYYITASTGICSLTDSIRITIRNAPVANAGPDSDICYGKTVQLTGSGGQNYLWNPSTYFTVPVTVQNPIVRPDKGIYYMLHVTDVFGCRSLKPDTVKISVTPAVKIFAGYDTVASVNQPIQLLVKERGNAGVISYSWSPANFLDNPSIATPVATLASDYRYIVTGRTADGCEGSDDIIIKIYKGPDIYVPSGFTPNNDGLNDVLKAIPVGIRNFHYFRVFNRWGQMIFSTQNAALGWDGRIKGLEQSTGTFIWIAEGTDYKGNPISRKGVVTIIR
jgi:gliding motility-associated-like protein